MNFLYTGERPLGWSGRFFTQANNISYVQVMQRNTLLCDFSVVEKGTLSSIVAISAAQEQDKDAITVTMIHVDMNVEDQEVLLRGYLSRNGLESKPLLHLQVQEEVPEAWN